MKVTERDVDAVADLANLELTSAERERMLKDLNSILEYIDRLAGLDTSNAPPMAQTSDKFGVDPSKTGSARFEYAQRLDELSPSLNRDEVMKNAPETDGAFFKVPRVIGKDL
jgi:aspartyl-tRNA(Asn)/glutamyl-tRNA(Gln) amidotransferase subunit C